MVINAEMCFYCFEVLRSVLYNSESPKAPNFPKTKYPLFVTWEIGNNKDLRGCIGTFEPVRLDSGLREYTITSAMKDSRFKPISKQEFEQLTVKVSLLTNFEDAANYRDWEVGVHGIRISFMNERNQPCSATYLPEVMTEYNWGYEETLNHLMRKGGYRGPITEEARSSVKLTRYQSEVQSMTYNEYMAFKNA